jgi:hypothetical protein
MIPISDTSGLYTGSTVEAALDEIGFDGARVSKVYESDFGNIVLSTDAVGQITMQPAADSATFFQVLDANGGIPVLNVNSVDEAVGIRSATTGFTLQGLSIKSQLYIEDADTSNVRAIVLSRKSNSAGRGTQSAFLRARAGGTAVQNGDSIGHFNFSSHDGTDYNLGCRFSAAIDGAVAANTVPTSFIISTSQTNSAGLSARLRVKSDGRISMGSLAVTSPLAQVHIDQSSTSAAIPVTLLDQADVDEPFQKFVGAAAAATLTRSIVAEADVTTATRQGFIKIEIEDIGNQVTDQDYFVPFYTLA